MNNISISPAKKYAQCQCCTYEEYYKHKVYEISFASANITSVITLCDNHLKELSKVINIQDHACDTCCNGICMDRDIIKPLPKRMCNGYVEKKNG